MAIRLGSIFLLPVFTRQLTPGEYGILELLGRATDVLLLCLFLNGICLAAIAFYNQARDDEARRRVVGSVLILSATFTVLVGLIAFVLAGPIAALIGVGDRGLVRLAVAATLADAVVFVGLTLIQARVEALRYTSFAMASLLIRVGLILVFVCLLGWGVRGILLASLITSGTLALILTTLEVRRSGLNFDRRTIAGLAWFALPFLPGAFCGMLLGTGDQLLLARYASTAEVGLYALGYRLAQVVGSFTRDPLMKVWGARMHQVADRPDAPRIFGRVFTAFVTAYLALGLGLVLFSREVIVVLGQARYLGAVAYIPPVVLAYFFWGVGDLMDAAFFIRRRSSLKLWITLASSAVTLGLYLALIPPYRALGAAYATLIGFSFRVALTYAVSQRLFRVDYEWDRIARVALAAFGCWGSSLFVTGPAWVALPVEAIIWALFPAILWVSGTVSPEEKRAICGQLDRARRAFARRRIPVAAASHET